MRVGKRGRGWWGAQARHVSCDGVFRNCHWVRGRNCAGHRCWPRPSTPSPKTCTRALVSPVGAPAQCRFEAKGGMGAGGAAWGRSHIALAVLPCVVVVFFRDGANRPRRRLLSLSASLSMKAALSALDACAARSAVSRCCSARFGVACVFGGRRLASLVAHHTLPLLLFHCLYLGTSGDAGATGSTGK